LGTGSLEDDIVTSIETALVDNPSLNVNILLDYTRGLRGEKNSKTMLEKLVFLYGNRFNLYFYHTPKLRGFYKAILPSRVNETIGVLHMKIYLIDDTLIISG
jgi:CDP-diacylglycerol--glycerol-3-phosphate 3-phosphatidyltransferase